MSARTLDGIYNLTNITANASDPVVFFNNMNTLSGGVFGHGFLIAFFVIVLVGTTRRLDLGIKQAFAGTSFATSILAILVRFLGWIDDRTMMLYFGLPLLAIVWLIMDRD